MKRWTSGEFCSVAHQKQYKEEYNQLALGRLLQAKPGDVHKPAEIAQPAATHVPVNERTAERDPKSPGFMVELPLAVSVGVILPEAPDPAPIWRSSLSFPSRTFEIRKAQLSSTAKAVVERSIQILDYATRRNDRGLDIREFTRNGPAIGLDLPRAHATGLEKCEEPLETVHVPHPPHGSPRLWQESGRAFDAMGTELGDLARAAFGTTGIQDNEDRDNQDRSALAAMLPMPDLATEPLPLTLNGLAATTGQPMQLGSTDPYRVEVQVPRLSALPLRPLMTFAPGPSPMQSVPLAPPPTLLDLEAPGLREKASSSFLTRLPGAAKAHIATGLLKIKKSVS